MSNRNYHTKELPKDWKRVKLGEVCKLKNGFAFKSSEYKNDGIPVIRISDIKFGSVTPDKSVRVSEQKLFDDFIIKSNEILVAMSGATTGKFGIYKSSEKAYQNQRVGKFQILDEEKLDNNFFLYQLHALKRQIEKDAYGGAQPNISSGKIEAMEILLPLKPTQLAIVSKIEELFSEIENGIKSLFTAKEQLKKYRQSVLKWAFEGKLTNGLNGDLYDLPDEHELSIAAEPEIEYIVERNHNNQANQKNHSSDKGELPEGWKMKNLKDICKVIGGVTKGRDFKGKETIHLPYLRVANVQDGYLDLDEIKTIEVLPSDKEKYELIYGDILYTEGGDKDKLGRGTIWKEEIKNCIHQNHIFRARPSSKDINSKYVAYFSQTRSAKNYFFKHGKQTTNLASINLTILSNLPIPICSINEQNIIVEAIESRLSVADKMEESITESLQQAEVLKQSILKKAFEGELI